MESWMLWWQELGGVRKNMGKRNDAHAQYITVKITLEHRSTESILSYTSTWTELHCCRLFFVLVSWLIWRHCLSFHGTKLIYCYYSSYFQVQFLFFPLKLVRIEIIHFFKCVYGNICYQDSILAARQNGINTIFWSISQYISMHHKSHLYGNIRQ